MVDTFLRKWKKKLVSKITGIYKSEINGIVIIRYISNEM